jgi:hypothetical protein
VTDALAQIDPTTLDRRELLDLLVVLSTTATRVGAELARRGDTDDDLIPVSTAARRLGVSRQYLYAKADRLPFLRRVGSRALRASARGVEEYLRSERARP